MNEAEAKKNWRIHEMRDVDLLKELVSSKHAADLTEWEATTFIDMLSQLEAGAGSGLFALTIKQRSRVEEVARRVFPVDSREVPKGKPVEEPAAFKNRPLKPPGRK